MEGCKLVTGISAPHVGNDIMSLLQDARSDSFDFISTNLPHSSECSGRMDITRLESKWWSTTIVGQVSSPSPYIQNMEESELPITDHGEAIAHALSQSGSLSSTAEKHLAFMLEWAGHMNIPAVILPPISQECHIQYGRFLSTYCLKTSASNVQLWVRVPFSESGLQSFREVHKMCDGPANLGCMLSFNSSNIVTPETIDKSLVLLHHFSGSNLRAVCFDTNSFLTNKKGYPTLSKGTQFIFTELLIRLGRTIRVIIEGESLHTEANGKSGYLSYIQYLRHLRLKEEVTCALDTEESRMESDYLDNLQSALQPCFDNLEFSTYEVFERDPVKYVRYREAIEYALDDKIKLQQLRLGKDAFANTTFVYPTILVVGAGRGPLVKASIDAITNINKKYRQGKGDIPAYAIRPKIVAVEKNPSAVIFLHSLKSSSVDWSCVDVVECDMRFARRNEALSKIITGVEESKADIVVSELLGSFGDNELSPECLDGVQRSGLMKKICVNIPQSYVSYLAPTSSMRLHSEAQSQAYQPSDALEGPSGKPCGNLRAMEIPYVVRTHAAIQTHKELECWEFSHPNKEGGESIEHTVGYDSNQRHAQLNFTDDFSSSVGYRCGYGNYNQSIAKIMKSSSVDSDSHNKGAYTLHGFLGTFHCTLYKSSSISIAPNSFSTGMYSWFPLYFPLREPLTVPHGATVRCNIWRKSDASGPYQSGGGVWYEWYTEVVDKKSGTIISSSNLHNPRGRSSKILL